MKFLIDGQTLSTPEINRGIGVVFKRICEGLVLNDISKEWLITVRDISDLKHFSPAVQKRLIPITVSESLNQHDYLKQTTDYSQALNKVVTELKIDAYWIPNPLMMNVILPTELCNVTIFATIYDLIPLMMSQDYLEQWPVHQRIEYHRRIEKLSTWADKLIFISHSANQDFETIAPQISSKSVVVPLGVDHTKFWSHLSVKAPSSTRYVLFTGGFDVRKNMFKALEAFSHVVKNNEQEFEDLKFYVVCACSDEARQNYEKLADELGVLDKLVLTGYVEDDELPALYQAASVFFFPSRYEGFGLPILEALACGLPVVTTKVSSIPEIIGDLAYYCSPEDSQDMAIALKIALRDAESNHSRRQEFIQQAQKFTWAETTASYGKLFTNTLLATNNLGLSLRKIAYVSPFPPQRSGIADYSFEIVQNLKQYVDITIYLEDEKQSFADDLDLETKNISLLPQEISKYDCVIYHIGNNTNFHTKIYKMAWQYPGIVVIHDFNIHPFLADAFLGKDDEYLYADALSKGYCELGKSSYQAIKFDDIQPEIWKFPMSHALAKRSLATIVHSRWVKKELQEIDNVFVIPHGSVDKSRNLMLNELSFKTRFKISNRNFLISTFGFIHRLKRPLEILQAIKILREKGYPIQLLIAGEMVDPSINLEQEIESLGISDSVIMTGYLNPEDFEIGMKLSDIVLNLRYPSFGESSGSLMTAFGYGKACIVSDYHQFAELPNSVCWKVEIGEMEVPQLVAYLEELMRNPAARKQLGKNAAFFAANYSSYEIAANLYAGIIERVVNSNKLSIPKYKLVTCNLPEQIFSKVKQRSFHVIGSSVDQSLVQHIEVNGCYEPHVQLVISKFLKAGDICIDIGANIGVHSILMSKIVGEMGHVFCYEASPSNHAYLKNNLSINSCENVSSEQVGLWDEAIELEFSYVEEVAGCSFFSTSGVREGEKQLVACQTLDSLIPVNPCNQKISLIKVDTEGSEIHVIRGAFATIQRNHPIIVLEINPETMKRFFSSGVQELYQVILTLGYVVHWIKSDGSLNELKDLDDVQLVFEREGLQWIDVACIPINSNF